MLAVLDPFFWMREKTDVKHESMLFKIAIGLLSIAVLDGAYLSRLHHWGKRVPMPLALVHGILADAGILLLLIGMVQHGVTNALFGSFMILTFAALSGGKLFSYHMAKEPLPKRLLHTHIGLALTGYLFLWAHFLH